MSDIVHASKFSAGAEILLELAKQLGTRWGDLERGLCEITEAASRALGVERTSVWLFDADQHVLRCTDLYECSLHKHSSGMGLVSGAFPAYFRALLGERALAVDSPQSDARTWELCETYLTPFGITATLDAPIRRQGRVVGVLCNEHTGPPRSWSPAEQSLAGSLADFAALVLEAQERRAAEDALRSREARLNAIMANDYFSIVGIREDGRFYFVSSNAKEVMGYTPEEMLLDEGWRHMHPADQEPARADLVALFRDRKPRSTAFRWQRGDGEWRWFEAQACLIEEDGETRAIGIARDVTERREAEAESRRRERQMVQAQKLEAVGQLAGGIAHDFNNVLTAILGHAEVALGSPTLDGETREELCEIRSATQRAAKLTRQLLSLSADQDAQPEVFELDRAVENLARMMRCVIGDHIECELDLQASPARVFVELTRFDQVLINLAINARDAMPEGGTLGIETRRVTVEPSSERACDAAAPGRYVLVAVRDDGVGIPEALRSRIFDPFFSTKGPGQGTGLGLTMVYAILKQAGGSIRVASEVGVGTCFTILLPEVAAAPSVRSDEAPPAPLVRGSGRILLVEDEWQLRQLLHRVLSNHGYQVQVAAHGGEGIEIVQQSERPFDLVVSDVLMPGMGGLELAEKLEHIYPSTPVLFVSGYSSIPGDRHPHLPPGADVLAKPFSPAALVERIQRVLERKPSAAAR